MANEELTVVIPAKDENTELRLLLECLKNQTFNNFDIIVADNSTTEIVRNICNENQIKCVSGGLPGPGRNNGASFAKANFLLFLDADVIIKHDFIESALNVLQQNNLDCISFGFSGITQNIFLIILHWVARNYFFLSTKIGHTHGIGGAILVKREIHNTIGGFDEKILVAEDHNYVKRIAMNNNYEFVQNPSVKISVRRFNKEGIFALSFKYFKIEIYRLFFGEIRTNVISYFDITIKKILVNGSGAKLRIRGIQDAERGSEIVYGSELS